MREYEMDCSMDVKLGLIRIPPGAPPRTEEQEVNAFSVYLYNFIIRVVKSKTSALIVSLIVHTNFAFKSFFPDIMSGESKMRVPAQFAYELRMAIL